jgi:hypothetical protein
VERIASGERKAKEEEAGEVKRSLIGWPHSPPGATSLRAALKNRPPDRHIPIIRRGPCEEHRSPRLRSLPCSRRPADPDDDTGSLGGPVDEVRREHERQPGRCGSGFVGHGEDTGLVNRPAVPTAPCSLPLRRAMARDNRRLALEGFAADWRFLPPSAGGEATLLKITAHCDDRAPNTTGRSD